MHIVHYPHPTLRHRSKPVRRVDEELRAIVGEMFELMYQAHGVGLAANQVDLPLRLFIVNLEAEPEEGEELVFINPVVTRPKGSDEGEEGCLSIPGLYAPVIRPKQVHIEAYDLHGRQIHMDLDGMLARVAQHETDHLDGVLFPDRIPELRRINLEDGLAEFEAEFRGRRLTGEIPDDDVILARLADWEARYC